MKRAMILRKRARRLAHHRISTLWKHASFVAGTQPELAQRWMSIASRIAQRARVRLPTHMRRNICKECGTVFVPGRNCRVRVRHNRSTHITVTCLHCGAIRRIPVARQA